MSTPELPDQAVVAPISPADLARLAGQLYSAVPIATTLTPPRTPEPGELPWGDASVIAAALPGPDTPPYTVPVAPRGSRPSTAPTVPVAVSPPAPWLSPVAPAIQLTTPVPDVPQPAGVATAGAWDAEAVRADFPILTERVNGHQLIWFDNAATTQKPQVVIDRLARFYATENSNTHRAAHELAARATDAYEDARQTVAQFLNASRPEEISFVRGATEGINLVAQSWGRANLKPGDEILITQLEHHANIVPWQQVAEQTGAVLRVAPVSDSADLLVPEFAGLLNSRTALVAVTEVANATGTVNPVGLLTKLARQAGARVLIDAAQSVPHLRVDLQQLDPDFLVFSGHKVFGPTGIGAVFLNQRVWDETPPWQGGGNMITDVTIERSQFQDPPNRYEAGTGNIADAVGLATALRYVRNLGLERIAAYEARLVDYAAPLLAAIPGVRLIGEPAHRASVLSFLLEGYQPSEVGTELNRRGIAVRAGHHCAQPILRRLGVEQTVRPSFAFYNTFEEIDAFLDVISTLSRRRR